ncbi:MAG: filamentous hemagglutinin [Alkalinema sp. CACIAM 70d]|nr:MAG: filamentous hemagglutinin [Alkalinema sp. CACIAM 70d]
MVLPVGFGLLWINPLQAQVLPDGTLSTTVSQSGQNFTINNGNRVGGNLFHSFSQFSVPRGGSAFFNNALTIQNIFARVTGETVSNIDGLIRANGTANLFLLNPSGILFGPNARLNLGGSFLGSSAQSVLFQDGGQFSASNTMASPLLTMSAPIGLQMGTNPGPINVQGAGRATILSGFSIVSGLTGTNGLQVASGKTLALVGGNVTLNGGVVVAPGGRIELGSVMSGSVALTSNTNGVSLSYPNATSFGNVQMTQRALASVQGVRSGSVQIQGKQVSLRDGSIVAVQNLGSQKAGDIQVTATEAVNIIGMSSDFRSSSGLINETLGTGAGGNIILTTPNLTVDQGGYVVTRNFTAASGGSITVNANDVLVGGILPGSKTDPVPVSAVLVAATYGSGKGGNLLLNTQNLSVVGGGYVGTRVFSTGAGGNTFVKADAVRVSSFGTGDDPSLVSLISANSLGAGNAGNLHLDTRTLSIQDGGVVSVSALHRGNAGNLFINASESIDISGVKNSSNPSYIGAVARIYDVRPIPDSKANAGNITINTPTLNIRNSGTVFVANQVLGNAGELTIHTDELRLSDRGSISASTKVGEGGNISLYVRDFVLLRDQSKITATAGGTGNGGDINLKAPFIVGMGDSDIIANAFKGRGGNINIVTQALLGLKYRDHLTPENDITASSEFGLSGTVQVNTIGTDPNAGLTELPVNVADASQKIATGCSSTQGSQFVATGRGGLPPNPNQELTSDRTWNDLRDLSAYRGYSSTVVVQPAIQPMLVQASGFQRNADGSIVLIANPVSVSNSSIATCSRV